MEIEKTFIDDLLVIHLNKIDDNRGSFVKMFNCDFLAEHNLRTDLKESYFSVSQKNVIRGMHFQVPPAAHTKMVFVNQGSIIDVVLDIRKLSATYGRFFSITISSDKPKLIYIPAGFAHGFKSLEDNTIVSYMQTSVYNKDCDAGIRWDSFGMDWKIDAPIMSTRDQLFEGLNNYHSPF
jgi:dTDP-4-dehydrorhamnose 3,5-epimerase